MGVDGVDMICSAVGDVFPIPSMIAWYIYRSMDYEWHGLDISST